MVLFLPPRNAGAAGLVRNAGQQIRRRDAEPACGRACSVCNFGAHMPIPITIAMIAAFIVAAYILKQAAHLIVTDFGIIGGLVAFAVIYCVGLIMQRYDI
jgi:hypothetical protein